MLMILLVLNKSDLLDRVLDAWSDAGVGGATILESTGLHRRRRQRLPMRYLFGAEPSTGEGNLTIFSIVESEAIVQACLAATEQITGPLNEPDAGVFTAWPLEMVQGLPKKKRD